MNKIISHHITALLGLVTAAVAIFHPGFTLPTWTQAGSVKPGWIVAGAIEIVHLFQFHKLVQKVTPAPVTPPAAPVTPVA